MPIIVAWANDEKTILLNDYNGNWSASDFRQAIDDNARLMGSVLHDVDVIVDQRNNRALPSARLAILPYLETKTPDNQRRVIVVGASRLMKTMIELASRFAPRATRHLHYVQTLEAAYQLIETLNEEIIS